MRSGCGSGRSARRSESPRSGCTSTRRIWGDWLPDLATGWTLIACGLVAWALRPESRSGPLLAATGFAWFAANLVGEQALYLYRGPLIHLSLSYPYGRLGRPLDRFRSCDRLRRRSRSGGLVERNRHVRAERALRRGRGAWLHPGARARAPYSPGRPRCHGVRLRRVGGYRHRPARFADPGADGRNAAGLRGRAVRAGGRAPGRARPGAVGADEGRRPRRRSASGGLRHSARRARPGARRSHARDRLLGSIEATSTRRDGRLCCRRRGRTAKSPVSTRTARRSRCWCTTRQCSVTRVYRTLWPGQRDWRPRTHASRRRSACRSTSSPNRADAWFTPATRSDAGSSDVCTRRSNGD